MWVVESIDASSARSILDNLYGGNNPLVEKMWAKEGSSSIWTAVDEKNGSLKKIRVKTKEIVVWLNV